jgi:serine/threonine protein phosphatase PrpC
MATPNKKPNSRALSKHLETGKSQKVIPKHRPSNSYGGSSSSEKRLEMVRQAPNKLGTSQNSERKTKETPKRPLIHKKSASISDKPISAVLNSLQNAQRKTVNKEVKVVEKFAVKSNVGFVPGNPHKKNQDSFILNAELNFDHLLFAVADGHGVNGEHVSGYIKDRYPQLLNSSPYLLSNTNRAIFNSASKLNREICSKEFDTNFSGSTFISVLMRHKKLWCANIGDSRALLGRQMNDKSSLKGQSNHWMSIALSRDHKPNEVDESNRIYSNGGRVEAYQDDQGNPFGPSRVWLKTQNIPGLAMSRSFGDKVASSVGVICEPEILEFDLTPDDKFVVLGSDGIFEFLNNEDVVKLVVPYWRRNDVEGAAEVLAKEARAAWMRVRFK